MTLGLVASHNTEFPQLEDDACGWDAAGTPERYTPSLVNIIKGSGIIRGLICIESWSIYRIVWLFPVLFLIHDLEEIITVKGFMSRNKDRIVYLLPRNIGVFVQRQFELTTIQFSVSVAFVFMFVMSATYLVTHFNFAEGAMKYFFIVVVVFFLHVFTHLGQALILRTYTPGVITSVLIILPYTSYVLFRLFRDQLIDWDFAFANIPFVLLAFPIIVGAHSIARKLVN